MIQRRAILEAARARTKQAVCAFLVLAILVSAPAAQTVSQTKISPDLLARVQQGGSQSIDVIVQYQSGSLLSGILKLVFNLGGSLLRPLTSINGGLVKLPLSNVLKLANDPSVAYVSLNRELLLASTDRYLQTVNADIAHSSGWTGKGISVAVIDSGISNHPDLLDAAGKSRVVYNESFVSSETPADLYGHGTHVAGIIAGNGYASRYDGNNAVQGMAPGAFLVNLKALDQHGSGSDADVIAAIERAISLRSKYNIKVINLSLGRPVYEPYLLDPLDRAVEAAYNAGMVVIVAAGNNGREDTLHTNGYGTINSPGNDPYVITVGASNTRNTDSPADDRIATYSSKGPTPLDQIVKPDLVAPGNLLISLRDAGSTLDAEYPQNRDFSKTSKGYSYFTLSGTSMATPVVAGAAALMLQKNATLSPDTVKARMMKTAFKNFSPGYTWFDPSENANRYEQHDVFTIGAGSLNVTAALASTEVARASAASPYARRVGSAVDLTSKADWTGTSTTLLGTLLGASSPWSTSVVWGSSGDWSASVVWGSGTTNDNGSSVVWGSSVCWGSGHPEGDSVVWGSDTNGLADPAQSSAQGVSGQGDPQ